MAIDQMFFDKIISQTHKHFGGPNDTKYINYDIDFAMDSQYLVNFEYSV